MIRLKEKLAIVAIGGGNALNKPKESPTAENIFKNLEFTSKCLVSFVKKRIIR